MAQDWTSRQLAAEFIATAMFVWSGCGAAIASSRWTPEGAFDPATLVSISLAFGLSISVLAYSIGHISGGHINPAITFAFMLLELQSITAGLLFMVAQFIGAIFGALILWGQNASLTTDCAEIYEAVGYKDIQNVDELLDAEAELANEVVDIDSAADDLSAAAIETWKSGVCKSSFISDGNFGPAFGLGVNEVNEKVSQGCAFFIEMMGTYLLVLTVLMAAVHTRSGAGNAAPIAIGWAIVVCHLQLIPYTGCGINPARSFGPMVVDAFGGLNKWHRGWWVFYTAPFVGALLAAATYKFIFAEDGGDDAAKKKKDDDHASKLDAIDEKGADVEDANVAEAAAAAQTE